jgi:tripeptidyl-peptidase-1
LVGGTSASTPIFSSIVNRINELRLNLGKKPIGFINPALYSNPWILNDITNGTNPGCGTVGFSAVPGWDPVTGLGEYIIEVI